VSQAQIVEQGWQERVELFERRIQISGGQLFHADFQQQGAGNQGVGARGQGAFDLFSLIPYPFFTYIF